MPTYTREEVGRILALRHGLPEGQGGHAYMEFRVKVTPEVLAEMMAATILFGDGKRARIQSVYVEAGYAELEFEAL